MKTEKKTTKRSLDDKIKMSQKICQLYELGGVTLDSCCGELGVTARTFWNWCADVSEIAELFKKAKDAHSRVEKEGIREKASTGLQRLVEGFWVEEQEVEEIFNKKNELVGKRVKKRKKYISPNATAIIFALKNSDPVHWNEDLTMDFGGEEQVFKIGDQTIKFK
jgi:hypothetical protein